MSEGRGNKGKLSGRAIYSLANAKDFTKELVAATPSQRNWKGILIALLVICAVLGLIFLSIYLLLPPNEGPRVPGRKVTIEDVISSQFVVEPFNGTWISDTELVFRDYLGGLSTLNVVTLTSTIFVYNSTFRTLNAQKFFVSPDRKLLLFPHQEKYFWKNSFLSKYTIYDIENEDHKPLTPFLTTTHDQEQPWLQWAGFVPGTGSLVFVHENDIYYKPEPLGQVVTRITNTGHLGVIYNGIPDWLYEGEIIKSNSAIWISTDGQYLVYASFNDTLVGESSYQIYGENVAYPKLHTLRYPKAGTTNPTVTLWAVNLKSKTLNSIHLKPPDGVDIRDHYFSSVKWVTQTMVVVVWMNRRQNISIISTCQVPLFQCQEIYTAKNLGTGWLDFIDPPIFSPDGKFCLLRIPWRDGEAGFFRHVILLDVKSRKETPITEGPFEVTEIVAWDQSSQYIYFIAAPSKRAGQRHLYKASQKSPNSTVVVAPQCMSCIANFSSSNPINKYQQGSQYLRDVWIEVSNETNETSFESSGIDMHYMIVNMNVSSGGSTNGTTKLTPKRMLLKLSPCLYNKVTFSPDYKHFIRQCLGPGVPTVTLHNANGRLLFVLDNNTALKEKVRDIGMPLIKIFLVKVKDGYRAPVKLYLPPGLREEEEFKFPLVLHVNGEPGSQAVSEKWSLTWNDFLVSENNYIVLEIDGRGTGYQGESIRHAIYQKLGTLEISDQLDVVDFLVSNISYIDRDNMAVYGRGGYGGFVAAHILARDNVAKPLFRCGISISPITKWEFHDSASTERYMGLPNFTDNYRGYEEADLTRIVKDLKHKNFSIIHGTADDTVHIQHTFYFTKSLIKEGISFTEQIYPDEGHSFKGVLSHFFMTLEAYLKSSFDSLNWDDFEKANYLGIQM